MERLGRATWPVKPRGSGRALREEPRYNGALGKRRLRAGRAFSRDDSDERARATSEFQLKIREAEVRGAEKTETREYLTVLNNRSCLTS
jgi:hypothetical protein